MSNERKPRMPYYQFAIQFIEKHGHKFILDEKTYNGLFKPMQVYCPIHGKFKDYPKRMVLQKYPCKKCQRDENAKKGYNNFLTKARQAHGDRYDYSKVNYISSRNKVEIICRKHGSFLQTPTIHVRGVNCPSCALESDRLNTQIFIERANAIHDNQYNYDKTVYTVGSENVIIGCYKHGYWSQRALSHLAGNGCLKCNQERQLLGKDKFIEKAISVHGNIYDYSKVVYTGNKNKVEIICPTHGSFWCKPNSHISTKNGCPRCCESKGEREISLILTELNINFEREFKISGYQYRWDFYIPDINLLIEFHGQQHYQPIDFFGGQKALEEIQSRDEHKLAIAKYLNYNMLVISYGYLINGKLKNHLIKELGKYFKDINKQMSPNYQIN